MGAGTHLNIYDVSAVNGRMQSGSGWSPSASNEGLARRGRPAFSARPLPATGVEQAVRNSRLAVMILIAAEAMIFTGLIGAFVVYRLGAAFWPPPGLPRLPLFVTSLNTVVLLGSLVTMRLAIGAARDGNQAVFRRRLALTGLLGATFLAVQGSEWVRLIAHGLRLTSGMYGATFYTLIGLHALHVTFAVLWLLWLASRTSRDRVRSRLAAVEAFSLYWYFVCAVWPVLFVLVYLP